MHVMICRRDYVRIISYSSNISGFMLIQMLVLVTV